MSTSSTTCAAPAPDLRSLFLQGMGQVACTVHVVTTDGAAGRAGTTVSAMASVSADGVYPSLLVCVHHLSPVAQAVLGNQAFCLNVLRQEQAQVSDIFSGRLPSAGGDKFAAAPWQAGPTGCPRLEGALVSFDCQLMEHSRVGSHYIFIGAVQAVHLGAEGDALLYAKRAYAALAPTASAA